MTSPERTDGNKKKEQAREVITHKRENRLRAREDNLPIAGARKEPRTGTKTASNINDSLSGMFMKIKNPQLWVLLELKTRFNVSRLVPCVLKFVHYKTF